MLRTTRLLLSFFLVVAFAGATPSLAADPSIVGSWKVTEAKGPGAKDNTGQTYTFEADGNMNISRYTKGKYTFDGKVVTIMFGTIKFVADVTFPAADTMIYKLRNSGGQEFTMKKE